MAPGFERARRASGGPARDADTAVEELVAAMDRVTKARGELDATELGLIDAARRQGLPWWVIARALRVATAQGACQRAQRLAERLGADRSLRHAPRPAPTTSTSSEV